MITMTLQNEFTTSHIVDLCKVAYPYRSPISCNLSPPARCNKDVATLCSMSFNKDSIAELCILGHKSESKLNAYELKSLLAHSYFLLEHFV